MAFPSAPTLNQTYVTPKGLRFKFDGDGWVIDTGLIGIQPIEGAGIDLVSGTGTVTISTQPGQLPGEPSTGNAAAGFIGEHLTATLLQAASFQINAGLTTNIVNIVLTPGDWDIRAVAYELLNATTVSNYCQASITTVSGNINAVTPFWNTQLGTISNGSGIVSRTLPIGPIRVSLSATTTYYLTINSQFTTNTAFAYGTISARRVR